MKDAHFIGRCAEWLKAADCKFVTLETLGVRVPPYQNLNKSGATRYTFDTLIGATSLSSRKTLTKWFERMCFMGR